MYVSSMVTTERTTHPPVLESINSRSLPTSTRRSKAFSCPVTPSSQKNLQAPPSQVADDNFNNNFLSSDAPSSLLDLNNNGAFNKYPTPVFIKTVKSARADRIKRGLAEGAARRTRVNNDLRDELTRIIQITTDRQQQQQFVHQQQQLQASVKKGPVAITRESNCVKTPDGMGKKKMFFSSSDDEGSSSEHWVSSSTIRVRSRQGTIMITPPNSAAATGSAASARNAGGFVYPQHGNSTPRRPRSRPLNSVETAMQPAFCNNNSDSRNDYFMGNNGRSNNAEQHRRRFIACVVSQNFALKLLQTPDANTEHSSSSLSTSRIRKSQSLSRGNSNGNSSNNIHKQQ